MASTKETLLSLHLEGFSGKVTIHKDNVTKAIFFKKGIPIYVESNVRNETLGQLLIEQKKISDLQYRMILDKMEKTGRRQGDCIVELGYMSGYEVYEALKGQMGMKFENCFLLEQSEIVAEEGDRYLLNVPEFPIDFFKVILDSAYTTQMSVNPALYSPEQALLLTNIGKNYLNSRSLQVREMKVIRLLDGKHTWSKVMEHCSGDEETLAAVIDALQLFKFIEAREPLPQSFKRAASEIAQDVPPSLKESSTPGSRVIEIEDTSPKKAASPIYAIALKLGQPLHKLLGITPEANKFQVKKSYDTLVRDLNLDSISEKYIDDEKKVAESVFDRVTLAFTVLSDDKKRHEYFQSLSQQKDVTAIPPPKIQAEVAMQKSRVFIFKKRLDDAEAELKKAIELDPEEPSYHVEYADIIMVKATSKKEPIPAVAEQEIRQAIKLNNTFADAYFQLGVFFKVKDEADKARGAFMKVIEIKPNHPKASAELRLINKRIEHKQKNESTFLKLFKKNPKKGGKADEES